MVKQLPKLTLVTRDVHPLDVEAGKRAQRFELLALGELSNAEKAIAQRIVAEISPKAGIVAVARTPSAWDLRPVVAVAGEDGPSIIRTVGPDIRDSGYLNARVRETFDRLSNFSELSAFMHNWGIWHGQLWYRRSLVDKTLAHSLAAKERFSERQILAIALSLVDEVSRWHAKGIVHGHIVSSNVFVTANYNVSLLDPAIGLALIQASRSGLQYDLQSFPPELLDNPTVSYSADIYGLGLVYRRLFILLSEQYQFDQGRERLGTSLKPCLELSNAMVEKDPHFRPSLEEIRRVVAQVRDELSGARSGAVGGKKPIVTSSRSAQGKIVVRGSSQQLLPKDDGVEKDSSTWRIDERSATDKDFQVWDASRGNIRETERESLVEKEVERIIPPSSSQARSVSWSVQDFVPQPPAYHNYIPPSLAPVFDTVPQQPPASRTSEANTQKGFWPMVFIFTLLTIALWLYRSGRLDYLWDNQVLSGTAELRTEWESKIPSRMLEVALVALGNGPASRNAETIIINSIINGERQPSVVNVGLIRVAFDENWETELTIEDRHTALALGLAPLLKDKMPQNLTSIDKLHPGVILALTANAGRNANKVLSNIPAEILTKLPPPYGPAFRELVEGEGMITCADESIQRLARFGTRGVEATDDIAVFLQGDSPRKLRALAMMFSQNNAIARALLEILIKHPNLSLDIDSVKWAKEWEITAWSELQNGDQLFIVAGIPPAGVVTVENIGKMFSHPNGLIRSYAIGKALDRIKMEHPGAYVVLRILENDPLLLGPRQTLELARLLESPAKVPLKTIQNWLESHPPIVILEALLLATAENKEATLLDTAIGVYLKTKNWKPDLQKLRRLSTHPDKYTRLFAYNEIYLLEDQETAREFLVSALSKETDPNYRAQLEQMISGFRLPSHGQQSAN